MEARLKTWPVAIQAAGAFLSSKNDIIKMEFWEDYPDWA